MLNHRKVARLCFMGLLCVAAATTAPASAAVDPNIKVVLEEPAAEIMTGIRNMRGYALGHQGIEEVVWYLDGALQGRIPYGGQRGDVQDVFPGYPDSEFPGFSHAWNYALMEPGEHTLTVRAYDMAGNHNDAEVIFTAARFGDKLFIQSSDLAMSEFMIPYLGVGDLGTYTVRLQWSEGTQQYVAREIEDEGPLVFAPGGGPAGLTATKTAGDVELSWTDVSNAEYGFHIERRSNIPAVGAIGLWIRIGTVSPNMEGFLDTSVDLICPVLGGCAVHEYRVFSFVPKGLSFASNIASVSQEPPFGPPLPPEELDPSPPLPVPPAPLPPGF